MVAFLPQLDLFRNWWQCEYLCDILKCSYTTILDVVCIQLIELNSFLFLVQTPGRQFIEWACAFEPQQPYKCV